MFEKICPEKGHFRFLLPKVVGNIVYVKKKKPFSLWENNWLDLINSIIYLIKYSR